MIISLDHGQVSICTARLQMDQPTCKLCLIIEANSKRYDEFHYIDEFENIHDITDLNLVEPFQKFPGAVILNEHLGCLQNNLYCKISASCTVQLLHIACENKITICSQ